MQFLERLSEDECQDLVDQYACDTQRGIDSVNALVRKARTNCGLHLMDDEDRNILEEFIEFVKVNRRETNQTSGVMYEKYDSPKEEPAKDRIRFLFFIEALNLLVANNAKQTTTLLFNNKEMTVGQVFEQGHELTAAVFAEAHYLLLLATTEECILIYDCIKVSPPFLLKKKIQLAASVSAMLFSETHNTLYLGMWDGGVSVITNMSHREGITVGTDHMFKWHNLAITVLKLVTRGKGNGDLLIVASLDDFIVAYDVSQQRVFAKFATDQGLRDCAWNAAYGALVSVATVSHAPVMWMLYTPGEFYNLTDNMSQHKSVLSAVSSHPSLPIIFTLDIDGVVKIWSLINLHIHQVLRIDKPRSRSRPTLGGLIYMTNKNMLVAYSSRLTRWTEHSRIEDSYSTPNSCLVGKKMVSGADADSEFTRIIVFSEKTGTITTVTGKGFIEWRGKPIDPENKDSLTYSSPQSVKSITNVLPLASTTCTSICVTQMNKVFIGMSDGNIYGYFYTQLMEKIQKATDAVCFILYSENRKQMVAGHTKGTLVFHTDDKTSVWGTKIATHCEVTCAAFVNTGSTLIAICTSIGTVHLIDTPARQNISNASASPHEINTVVSLTQFPRGSPDEKILFATGTSGGIIHVWQFVHGDQSEQPSIKAKCKYRDFTGFVPVLRASRKASNPDFLSKKFASKAPGNRQAMRRHNRRPAITVLGTSNSALRLLFSSDDAGWVSVYDFSYLTDVICSENPSLLPVPGKRIKMVIQWRAHDDEICAMAVTDRLIVTSAILKTTSLMWSYSGSKVGELSASGPGPDLRGHRNGKHLTESVIVPQATRSSLGLPSETQSEYCDTSHENDTVNQKPRVQFPLLDTPPSPVQSVIQQTKRMARQTFSTTDSDDESLTEYLLEKKRKHVNRLAIQRQGIKQTQDKETPEATVNRIRSRAEPGQWLPRTEVSKRGKKWDGHGIQPNVKPKIPAKPTQSPSELTNVSKSDSKVQVSEPPKGSPPEKVNPRHKLSLCNVLSHSSLSGDMVSKSPRIGKGHVFLTTKVIAHLQDSRPNHLLDDRKPSLPQSIVKSGTTAVSVLNIKDMRDFSSVVSRMKEVEESTPARDWSGIVKDFMKGKLQSNQPNLRGIVSMIQQGKRGFPKLKKPFQQFLDSQSGGGNNASSEQSLDISSNKVDTSIRLGGDKLLEGSCNPSPNHLGGGLNLRNLSPSHIHTSSSRLNFTKSGQNATPDTPLTPDSVFFYNEIPFSEHIEQLFSQSGE